MTLPRLHAVTDDRVLALPDFLDRARAMALGPAVALHVRTQRDGAFALKITDQLVALAAESGTQVIVNDRADVAALAEAAGVHLPANGMPVHAAREAAPTPWWVGQSTHTAMSALASTADWAFLGPIWPTGSHPDHPALGADALRGAGPRVVAIGGLTPVRAREAVQAGAIGIAAISALWDAPDPGAAAHAFLLSFEL
jgi:thiamine-phosphate diphosphorylase